MDSSVSPSGGVAESAPAILADLIAAGLVSHEMIGDPAQLGSEAATLRALCGLIGGPVYRIEPFHYAFRLEPGDLAAEIAGGLGSLAPDAWTGTLERALQGALGADAVWLNATADLMPETEAGLDQPLLLLRAHDAAVVLGLEAAEPGTLAVINAHYAAETVRLTAELAAEARAEAEQDLDEDASQRLEARLAAAAAAQAETAVQRTQERTEAGLVRLSEALDTVLRRLDAQAEALRSHLAAPAPAPARLSAEEMDEVAARIAVRVADSMAGRLAARQDDAPAFQETLGLTLAEFLARMEQRTEALAGRGAAPLN